MNDLKMIFSFVWEQRKLGDILIEFVSKTKVENEFPVFSSTNKGIELREGRVSGESNKGYKIIEVGDLVLSPQNLWLGNINVNEIGKGIVSPSYRTFTFNNVEPSFIKPQLRSDEMLNQFKSSSTQGASVVRRNLDNDLFNEIEIKVPSNNEQKLLGNFFDSLDSSIVLHQRKLECLKNLKKSLLQKMFPKDSDDKPEIRFTGFTDSWEQRKLGDVAERITRKNTSLESDLPLTISAQFGLVDQREFFDKRIASQNISGYYLLKKGDFAYNKSYSNDYPWGAVKRLEKYDSGVVSTLYIVFSPAKIDSDYLSAYYETTLWYKEVEIRSAEGARNHGLLNIASSDFFDTEISMPKSFNEQHLIGSFFSMLDSSIVLHQRKLECLQNLKKSLLQKMFI
jgi:type I restriction enzyme S subunit